MANGGEGELRRDDDEPTPERRRPPRRPPVGFPLLLVLAGVLGNFILVLLSRSAGTHPLTAALTQVFTGCLFVGAVWLGALMAYRDITRRRR